MDINERFDPSDKEVLNSCNGTSLKHILLALQQRENMLFGNFHYHFDSNPPYEYEIICKFSDTICFVCQFDATNIRVTDEQQRVRLATRLF